MQKASDACQKQFNQAFLRILIDRLTTANSRLSARSSARREEHERNQFGATIAVLEPSRPIELQLALLTSTVLVAVAEIGDKTQLLSFVLAARLRKPGPIIAGILAATLVNHAAAAWAGSLLAGLVAANRC